ncbi:hypothetical protein [Sulfitobacter sp. 1A12779]|uniref:polysaccharide biosynthesis C-terminal domain-containing protein n=1 Tax=Sulfitobacter sp. 1A12779 TaxID=3368599 RepID=UPI003745F783
MMRLVATGASSFVAQNLVPALQAQGQEVMTLAEHKGTQVDHIFHLAGANRPPEDSGFQADNVNYAQQVLEIFLPRSDSAAFHYALTIRVTQDSAYGRSKKAGEELVCSSAGDLLSRKIAVAGSFWTRPIWAHDLTNTGSELAVLAIWANEIYDPTRPNTITSDAVHHCRMQK